MTLKNYFLAWSLLCCTLISTIPLFSQTTFTDQAQSAGIDHFYRKIILMGGGAAWFDYNNDGHEDVYITAGDDRDGLYKNLGNGNFSDVSDAAGLGITSSHVTNGVVTGDIDNDGDRDILVTTTAATHNLLFKNNGDGTFTDISQSSGIANEMARSMIASFGDINLDGLLDIYVGNYVEQGKFILDSLTQDPIGFDHKCYENFFYINNGVKNGKITFSEIGSSLGVADSGCALATAFTDFDEDGDMDILLANDFGEWITPNKLFQNNDPANNFSNISKVASMDAQMYGMGIAIGDYDRDYDLDYYITNIARNGLFQNQGDGTFDDVTQAAGVEDIYVDSLYTVGWGTIFADVDNDTDLDLFVTNGHVPALNFIKNALDNPDRLFQNLGGGIFLERGAQSGINTVARGRGSACADYDNDGDIDYLMVPTNERFTTNPINYVQLFRNELSSNDNWLRVKLEGTVNNRDAFGSHIKVVLSDRGWLHEISGGSSHGSQNSSIAHLGLANATQVDTLLVTWPGGKQQMVTDVQANQTITIVEDESLYATSIFSSEELMTGLKAYPNPFSQSVNISYQMFKKSQVELSIYNQMGQHIITLENKVKGAGMYEVNWNGESKTGQRISSGLYFARLTFNQNRITVPIQYFE